MVLLLHVVLARVLTQMHSAGDSAELKGPASFTQARPLGAAEHGLFLVVFHCQLSSLSCLTAWWQDTPAERKQKLPAFFCLSSEVPE